MDDCNWNGELPLKKIEFLRKLFEKSSFFSWVAAAKTYLFHITPERMNGANCSVKRINLHGKWMAQADPPKKAITVKKMNCRSILLTSNKMTHYFKECTTSSDVLKKLYCLYKNLVLQIDPLNSSCS